MLMRSTGLGKTELKGKIVGLIRQQEYLVLQVDTIEPVKWKNIKLLFSTKWKAEPSTLVSSSCSAHSTSQRGEGDPHPSVFGSGAGTSAGTL